MTEADGDGTGQSEEQAPQGYTFPETGIVYVETARDLGKRAFQQQLPMIAAHELGHQFGLAVRGPGVDPILRHREKPVNLMSGKALEDSASDPSFKYEYIRLHPVDIAAIRKRVHSPGKPG